MTELGCQYIGPLPIANINSAFHAQMAETTTQPSEFTSQPIG
jgi:hypothetical protein